MKTQKAPLTRHRQYLTPNHLDNTFSAASGTLQNAQVKLSNATRACVFEAAANLIAEAERFKDQTAFITNLRLGVMEKDLIKLASTLRAFLKEIDLSQIDFSSKLPKPILIAAVMCLKESIADWSDGKLQDAYHNTVRCRASLEQLGKTK